MSKQGFLYDLRGRRSSLEASQTKFLWGQGAFPRKGPFIYKLQEKQKKKKERKKKHHVSSDGITNPVFCKTVFVYLVRYKNIHPSVCDKKRGLEITSTNFLQWFPPSSFFLFQIIFGSGHPLLKLFLDYYIFFLYLFTELWWTVWCFQSRAKWKIGKKSPLL